MGKADKYNVGDRVRVRADLDGEKNYGLWPSSQMVELAGKVVTITRKEKHLYHVKEQTQGSHWWTDEMFTELVEAEEEKPMLFKLGDKVVANEKANARYTITRKGWIGTVIEIISPTVFVAKDDDDGDKYKLEVKYFDLVEAAPAEPAPTTVNVNITINLYENACWYCKEGGLVDRIFAGQLGICPCCGRVCNDTAQATKSVKPANPFKPAKK